MLVADALEVSYGKVEVLRGLDMTVQPGEVVALLGPNGCGKSTTVKSVAGLVSPRAGTLRYDGADIAGMSIRERVTSGITLVAQGRTLFSSMSVEENLLMGAFARSDDDIRDDCDRWLDFFPGLRDARRRPAGQLSGGQQRMVAVARGLMARPSLLMLDEPSLGVAPAVLVELGNAIRQLRDDLGLGVVLVEQDIPFALDVADRVLVLASGRIALEESPDRLRGGEELREVYFGHHASI
ncbi:MAG TPA: ABC transporter ATP-binding protein [Acidimicrobiales bacterium]|nr:ABC transporter ATP-binding protein [Acidimicrobiales bacterium]